MHAQFSYHLFLDQPAHTHTQSVIYLCLHCDITFTTLSNTYPSLVIQQNLPVYILWILELWNKGGGGSYVICNVTIQVRTQYCYYWWFAQFLIIWNLKFDLWALYNCWHSPYSARWHFTNVWAEVKTELPLCCQSVTIIWIIKYCRE